MTLVELMAFKIRRGEPIEWVDLTTPTISLTPIPGHIRMRVVLTPPLIVPDIRLFRIILEHDTGSGIVSGTAYVSNEHFDIEQFLQ